MCKEKLKDIEDGVMGKAIRELAWDLTEMDIKALERLPDLHVFSGASSKEAEKLTRVYWLIVNANTDAIPTDTPDEVRDEIIKVANKYIDLATEQVTSRLIKLVKE